MKRFAIGLLLISLIFSGCLQSDPAHDARNKAMVSAIKNVPLGTSLNKVEELLGQYSVEYSLESQNHLIGILRNVGSSNPLVQTDTTFDFNFDAQNNLSSKKFKDVYTGM